MKTFFTFISKLNSLFLFGILVSVLLLVAWEVWSSFNDQRGDWSSFNDQRKDVVAVSDDSGTKVKLRFHLGIAEDIPGSNAQMLDLISTTVKPSFAPYGGTENDTRNILFLTGDERVARWLFPHQNNVIHHARQLWLKADPKESQSRENQTTALYIKYSDKDSNGDGEISKDDRVSLGLSKPDGEGFVTVLTGIDRLFSISMLGDRTISVLYQTGEIVRHAQFSVATLAKSSDQVVVAIPAVEFRE